MADGSGWHRGRTTVVVLVLLAGLVAAGAAGASLLFAKIPSTVTDPVTVTCWDGKERDADDCGRPTGVRGLRWVFPSFRPGEPGCRDVLEEQPEFAGPTRWACRLEVAGSRVVVTYSELPEAERGLDAVRRGYGDVDPTTVETRDGSLLRYEWRRPVGDGFEVLAVYADHPYAVEVRAGDEMLRDEALARVVRFRAPGAISHR